jgi:hypothetical protein
MSVECEDNSEMDVTRIGYRVVDWIYLAQKMNLWLALRNTLINFGFHKRRETS